MSGRGSHNNMFKIPNGWQGELYGALRYPFPLHLLNSFLHTPYILIIISYTGVYTCVWGVCMHTGMYALFSGPLQRPKRCQSPGRYHQWDAYSWHPDPRHSRTLMALGGIGLNRSEGSFDWAFSHLLSTPIISFRIASHHISRYLRPSDFLRK